MAKTTNKAAKIGPTDATVKKAVAKLATKPFKAAPAPDVPERSVQEVLAGSARVERRTILERSVCMVLTCGYIGNERAVDLDDLTLAEARTREDIPAEARKQLSMRKVLVDRRRLAPIKNLYDSAKHWLRGHAVMGVMGLRTYLVTIPMFERVEQKMQEFQSEIREAAEELARQWSEIVEERREALGPLFDESEYLTPEQVAAEFTFEWSYVDFSLPDRLQSVNSVAVHAVQERWGRQMDVAFQDAMAALREQALQVARQLLHRLQPAADGRTKGLRGTALNDLMELFDTYRLRDLGNDTELDRVLSAVRKATSGVDVEALKDNDALRARVRKVTEQAVGELDALVVATRGRGINLTALPA